MKAILIFLTAALGLSAENIPIVLSPGSGVVERTAADELAAHLIHLHPRDAFPVTVAAPARGRRILLGTPASLGDLPVWAPKGKIAGAESFAVTNRADTGIVLGADARGVLNGVYALLEKLGFGFYLSYDAAPSPRSQPFDFTGWNLAGAPVYEDRVIFNWHNFLSSASTWELEDWQRWIRGAARMRYNTVMVHAYGNNPMFSFRHNGQAKPVGYLATTQNGRDWGTQHVNDVRRLWGGSVFQSPVFGSSAALVPEQERAPAAQAMVRKAFDYARTFGLHVTFALDVDTESANPQSIILTLPASARFQSGKLQLPNPDTPEGHGYWKAQVDQLLASYPQIDRLVVWFRADRTPWRNVKPEEFPAAWQVRYESALAANPGMRGNKDAPSMFAIGRIAAAFARALRELGRNDVQLAGGTWHPGHLPAAHVFFEPGVKLYWLDWSTIFDQPATQAALRAIPRERPMLPIVWAHHDDRTYIGRPYIPFPKFTSLVDGVGTGFGIIHWTTRPLDIYFKSLAEQVWSETRDRPLADTARDMAARSFGATAAGPGAEYYLKWLADGRMFGRETSDRFIDVPLKDSAEVIAHCRERLAILARIDENALTPEGRERVRYQRDYEEFTAGFFRSHAAFERAQELHHAGRVDEARAAIAEADPRGAIELYARAASHGGMSRGEQALIVSLNLRWRPFIVSLRQALGLEPARFKFQPTQHEPLAQGPGNNTFHVDEQGQLWKALGEKETGAPAFGNIAAEGACGAGVQIDAPLALKLAGIMGDRLAAGLYRAELRLSGPAAVSIGGAPEQQVNSPQWTSAPVQAAEGRFEVKIRPGGGPVRLCSAIIALEGKHQP